MGAGLAYTRQSPMGKRRVHRKLPDGKILKMDVWDPVECRQIREIWQRRRKGESIERIGEDFYRRKLKTANGKRWVRCNRKQKRRSQSRSVETLP